jgi:hypothetical protein
MKGHPCRVSIGFRPDHDHALRPGQNERDSELPRSSFGDQYCGIPDAVAVKVSNEIRRILQAKVDRVHAIEAKRRRNAPRRIRGAGIGVG